VINLNTKLIAAVTAIAVLALPISDALAHGCWH
jgi:hypothetical protein